MGSLPASADTAPLNPNDPKTPLTVAGDALPTAQHNGVAWYQTIVGNTVYVVGKFTTARPAGAAPNTNTVVRNNILAYSLTTGALITTFAPSLNGQALAITASPDGTRLYVGGDFTSVSGVTRNRIVALNPSTGAVISTFAPNVSGQVRAIVATNSTVYFGGNFSSVNSRSRGRLAAVQASNGALLSWAPVAANGKVNALALSPDATRIVVGGAFTTLNGSDRPGYGLGQVSATTGGLLPFAANNVVRNAGTESAILSLASDGTNVYGTGYIYGTGGNLEGAFSANWSDGAIKWIEDCHGDSYGVWPTNTAVYVAGHPHYCLNLGGYGEMPSGTAQRAIAFSKAATGVLTKDTRGYPSFTGQPAPSLQNWFPQMTQGTASGQGQAAWTVTGTGSYVVMAGEFPSVNNVPQQGMVRFAVKEIAPNKFGPRATGTNFQPTLSSPQPGQVRVNWVSNFDYDNSILTYRVYRDGGSTPIYTVTQASTWWQRPSLSYLNTGLAGGTHSYRLTVTDPFNNSVAGPTVSITIQGAAGNTAPTASFTSSVSGRTVSVNGSGSSDPDGTIASYAWTFGDGATASGATANHTYAADGTYTVTLKVTDNGGAVNSTSRSVTVGGTQGVVAQDGFGRIVTGGWGTADTGGPWALNGSSGYFAVNNGTGLINLTKAGIGPNAFLGVSATALDTTVTLSMDKVGNGGGTYLSVTGRKVGTSEYLAKVGISSAGAVTLSVTRMVSGTETTLKSAATGLTYSAGQQLQVRLQVTGTSPTTIAAKVWRVGTTQPSGWLVSASDATSGLQSAGGVALRAYLSGSATNFPIVVRFDNLSSLAA
ncbi:PKD repeat protein [Microlunatus panaciterrae]|uniref:PKD repeat protein n=1 Tax=Microlunatus panaciterrae TaxID=400768 RepID=A0ABS2RHS7_9ACTN|nr:PKD domain-containing protein [Microlunatus panaciterrae]MBM7798512.1 PKD repeat protein [Microlunatus panaciterrae]